MKLWRIGLIICLLSAPFSLSNRITLVKATSLVTLLPIADAYVDSEHTTSNYGGADYLYAQFWDYTYIADVRENSYLMFNLTRFSPLSEISSASLRLYAWSAWSPTTHVGVHQCSDTTWNEITINWLNAPSFSPSASDIVAVPFEDTWYSWNVTSLVNNALGSKLTLVLSVEDIGDSYTTAFYSKDGWQNNPELLIELKDGDPPAYANFHLSKDFVKSGEDFVVSVDLYDPSGISEAQAVFLDAQQNDMMNVALEGSGANGTYSETMHFNPTTVDGIYSVKIYAVDGVGNDGHTSILGTIVLDNLSPFMSILTPENKPYSMNSTVLNFVVNEVCYWIGYCLDGQANVTIAGNTTLPSLVDGSHSIIIYARDNAGNTGVSSRVTFTIDTNPPNIANVSQIPLKENVQPSDIVKVNATVTDVISGVKQVFLNYTVNNGAHFTVNMTQLEGNIYTATIAQSPYGTNVTYGIVAEDNANNTITTQGMGFNFGYSVVPEVTPFMILPLFMIVTLLTLTVSKSTCKTNKRIA